MKILDGKVVRNEIMVDLKERIQRLGSVPNLAIIMIGNNPDSAVYVKNKISFAQKIGANAYVVNFPPGDITQEILLAEIEKLNKDEAVNGIIIQAPLPAPLDWAEAVEKVCPEKDVDGLCSVNVKNLSANNHQGFVPATARGVLTLLGYYELPVKGKKVVVMGRSTLVGRPIATLLTNEGATVTIVHSKTIDPEKITREADVLVVAIGQPELIGADYVREGQVVVDVGITSVNRPRRQNDTPSSSDEGGRSKPSATVVGDIDFDSIKDVVSAISLVPGGVGPMTVASLFQNLVEGTEKQTTPVSEYHPS